ncbi:glycosyltransferase [Candidatus Desulfovibrio trichonymphae]|uniref:Putative glycosyltransferase involved in cell wall biogenesis n=1 Tax=Candidatus Desulfovibrio trichonymphae TaxID=1725232 RepID=A0A1J1DWM1_9BACT|nr:glycosyltransferase [Candidatus Desulfovibrio trichonymphae]BAV92268.1 putative glycosyltransferase involved in cell wall biogenesis [Candidatus Desulfovibrio trichonymphae]GHU92626.1 glycosyl transferase family 1 [Deltaproteobacteria bacterium]
MVKNTDASTKLNILFFMEDLCYGGTQRQTLELACRLDRKNFTPAMLTLTGPTDMDEAAREVDIVVHHLGRSRKPAPLFFLRLCRALQERKPDILVPCTALPNIWGRIWGRLLRVPVVVGTCRGGGSPARQYERLLWRLTHHLICNSAAVYQKLQGIGVPVRHVSCVANGVDVDHFVPGAVPPSGREPVILCVARLVRDKDHLTLLRAFAQLLQTQPKARLRIVGDGGEAATLRAWAERHAAGARVDFFPGSADMRGHYAAARVFALSSVREGQPNVILEAMSCGLSVCATAVGGIPALVQENVNGLLSPAGDAASLARNCVRLLADPSLCDVMGRAGRELVVRNFSFTAMVEAHQRIFVRLWEAYGQG